MKNFLLAVSLTSVFTVVQAQPLSVEILVKQKSGFLGLGRPRSMTVELSNQGRQEPLTSTNINAGPFYYFLCRPVGEWQFDFDFLKEDLPKLSLLQKEQKLSAAWKSDFVEDSTYAAILVGFPKELKLYEPILVQFQAGDSLCQAEIKVAEQYWPGYTIFTDLLTNADSSLSHQQYREAITACNRLLSNQSFQIFPRFAEVKDKRTQIFDRYLTETWSSLTGVQSSTQLSPKQKIGSIDRLKPVFLFIGDSLTSSALNVSLLEPAVRAIAERANNGLVQASSARDSLQRVLDDENTRWIIAGSMPAGSEYLYKTVIEAVSAAFSSLDFRDSSKTALRLRVSDDLQARLGKYNLTESFETFLRLCNDRYNNRLPIFPPNFLPNLQKDSAAFPLPYYSVLKAINDYYYGSFDGAKREIFKIFRTSYDPELCMKFDRMRVQIGVREANISPEVLKVLQEAETAELRNDTQAATEKYLQLSLIAPNFAFGSFATGKFFARTGDPTRAFTFFQRAYTSDTLFFSAYREAYSGYRKTANYKPMIDVLTQAFQKGNDNLDVHFNLGLAYMGDGDVARAIQHFERALELNPLSYQTNIQLGLAYQSVKNYPRARDFLVKAVDIDPVRQEAVELLNKLNELQKAAH